MHFGERQEVPMCIAHCVRRDQRNLRPLSQLFMPVVDCSVAPSKGGATLCQPGPAIQLPGTATMRALIFSWGTIKDAVSSQPDELPLADAQHVTHVLPSQHQRQFVALVLALGTRRVH